MDQRQYEIERLDPHVRAAFKKVIAEASPARTATTEEEIYSLAHLFEQETMAALSEDMAYVVVKMMYISFQLGRAHVVSESLKKLTS